MTFNAAFQPSNKPLACVQFHLTADGNEKVVVDYVYAETLASSAEVVFRSFPLTDARQIYEDLLVQGYVRQPISIYSDGRVQSLAHPDSVIGRLHPLGVLLPREDL